MKTPADNWGKVLLAGIALSLTACTKAPDSLDDLADGRKVEDFHECATDVFKPMDGGIELSADEIKGRNTWNMWTAGNEQFWDHIARNGFGMFDLLKTLDSRNRAMRFQELGLINEPGFKQAGKPDAHGLWLDERQDEELKGIDPKVFGKSTGVMGFRLFPNPAFDAAAKKAWDPDKFYSDPDYAANPRLVRPYRVGVSCGACHIAFDPLRPPADPANPRWENLASAIGNQYFNEGGVFAPNVKAGGFFYEMIRTQPRGTSDTSRIATDNNNNPNAINPIFLLGSRIAASAAHIEEVEGETLLLPDPDMKPRRAVLRVLKDGSDSVGVVGATLRVFINIGEHHQHWLRQHNALIGLKPQQPFSIKTAQKHSVFWNVTQGFAPNIAKFFTRLQPMHLADAPGGADYLTKDGAVLARGKILFAQECARCHSSKQPPADVTDARAWFEQEVQKPDFLTGNFLSDEERHPITEIKTNAGRALGTNGMKGHIWANFSSTTYKKLESPGVIKVWNPYTGSEQDFEVPSGGPGYYRTPSLISLWTSAPFFHNNALGNYTGDPSVAGRMAAFDDAVEKLLWPAKRLGEKSIWRTSQPCAVQIQASVLPDVLRLALKECTDPDGFVRIGHIPAGTPVNLIANVDPDTPPLKLAATFLEIHKTLKQAREENLDDGQLRELMKTKVAPMLFAISKSPDFIEDRGHEYGAKLPDDDKKALIEYLKTK